MTVKFVALVVLIFAVNSNANEESSLDRRKCKNSEPFYIKNEKKRKSYLTVDLETNAVNGAKKNGEANQQWRWSRCKKGATHLVNVATGGCLTLEGSVSDECDTVWEHGDDGVVPGTGTLFGQDDNASGFARLMKRSPELRIVQEVNFKVGTSVIQDWFLWGVENV